MPVKNIIYFLYKMNTINKKTKKFTIDFQKKLRPQIRIPKSQLQGYSSPHSSKRIKNLFQNVNEEYLSFSEKG